MAVLLMVTQHCYVVVRVDGAKVALVLLVVRPVDRLVSNAFMVFSSRFIKYNRGWACPMMHNRDTCCGNLVIDAWFLGVGEERYLSTLMLRAFRFVACFPVFSLALFGAVLREVTARTKAQLYRV